MNVVFQSFGVFIILIAFYLIIGVKELYKPKSKEIKGSLMISIRQFLTQIVAEKSLIVVYISNLATTSTTICTYQYGFILYDE